MPPPPSQQGKFKPKKPKPKKKIKAGAATADASAAAAAEPKATVSFAPSPYAGRGGRGRGRGGRGRGRMPMPTGKVYFTGGEKKKAPSSASGSRSSRSSSRTTRSTTTTTTSKEGGGATAQRTKKDTASTEEVVGQLEVAIGSSKDGPKSSGKDSILDSMDFEDQEGELFRPAGVAQGNASLEGFMYDTDSSEEEESARKKTSADYTMAPLALPLKDSYTQSSETEGPKTRQAGDYPEPVSSDPTSTTTTEADGATRPSPFEDLASQKDDWLLVQLPTRLPPLRQKVDESVAAMNVDEDEEREQVTSSTEETTSAYSEVVTHPVVPGGFDNALLSAAPGRIGKMIVYKSGKTVLVMEGTDGSTLQLNVAEGLSCSFLQQAVAIDSEKNTYTELGGVGKSLVVSPVLDRTYH
ncbi:MAG: hypothetical protein SGBAC_007540 [Bacillariaceae sp.]